ncbi:MAG: nuclear transport factor 2 family protein [Alphaproteobacteria bacterium]
MSQEDLLAEMVDHYAIKKLMVRYAERIDANDPEGAAACFAEDGIGHYWGEYQGRDAIAERLVDILDAFAATSHHLSNVMLEIDGDTATGLSYVYAFHRYAHNFEPMHYWGRWVDKLVKVDGVWLFAEREVVGVGQLSVGDPPSERPLPGHPGRLARKAKDSSFSN